MATYHQYSEIVAAYGYKLPPARPENLRVGLSLLYAAVGVALGTLAGTALAVVSTQPGAAAMRHFHFAHSATAAIHAPATQTSLFEAAAMNPSTGAVVSPSMHPLVNLGIQHAAADESLRPMAGTMLQPPVNENIRESIRPLANASVAAAPVPSSAAAPVLPSPTHPVAAAPRAELSSMLKPAVVPSAAPVRPYLAHRQASLKHGPTMASTRTILGTTKLSGTRQPIAVAATAANAAAQSTTLLAATVPVAAQSTTALATAPTILFAQSGLDMRPAVYYSEGDVTVADYDPVAGTIQTTDGKIFLIGPTVSESNATSWDEYRANVHYRCNQSGSCMLVRAGVVALNAKMI